MYLITLKLIPVEGKNTNGSHAAYSHYNDVKLGMH